MKKSVIFRGHHNPLILLCSRGRGIHFLNDAIKGEEGEDRQGGFYNNNITSQRLLNVLTFGGCRREGIYCTVGGRKERDGEGECTVPKEFDFLRYNMKFSGENLILRGIVYAVSCFPLRFMLYRGNLN